MADMIIKPSSGNSLVFQDEGGDPALTVGTTGNTTLAGTANNLGTISSATTFPAGHVLQVKGTHNDYNWGSLGNNTNTHCSWVDVVLTTKGANSNFLVMPKMNATDTSNTAFGWGLGCRYQPTGGSQVTLTGAHQHEHYHSTSGDKYYVTNTSFVFDLSIAINTELTFQLYFNFNDGGAYHMISSQHGSSQSVMEIKT